MGCGTQAGVVIVLFIVWISCAAVDGAVLFGDLRALAAVDVGEEDEEAA